MRFSTYTSSCLFAVLSLLNCFGQAPRQNPRYSLEQFASLPLPFEQNVGQNDPSIRFVSESPGYEVCFERGQIVMVLHGAKGQTKSDLVKISILGADSTIEPQGI